MSRTKRPWLTLRFAMKCILGGTMLCAGDLCAQAVSNHQTGNLDVSLNYIAGRSLEAGSAQNFWMHGASFEAGSVKWRWIGPALNFSGSATGSIGSSNVPLSLLTVTAGPRVRLRDEGKWSPYVEVLFGVAHGFNSTFPNSGTSSRRVNSFALQAGGGVDVRLQRFFVRVIDVSYVQTQLPNGSDGVQSTLRIGAGAGLILGHSR